MTNLLEHIDFDSLNQSIAEHPEACCRLFHGRGHCYPGLEHVNVDWLSPVVLITVYQPVNEDWLMPLADALKAAIPAARSIQLQHRYQQQAPIDVLLGESLDETVVTESGLKYKIELGRQQNTGLFLDMKNGRDWVRSHARDKKVLNLFAYTCGFSVAAIAGGASQVINMDMSRASLAKGRDNHRLNHQLCRENKKQVLFEGVDIFKSFGRIKKHGPYELLICDPPAFQKGSVNIKRDYKKIIRRIPEFMQAGSDIMLCLNAPDLDERFLQDMVSEACPACEFISSISPPSVFKECMPGKGLKVQLYRYSP